MTQHTIHIRWLGQQDYLHTWQMMQQFTNTRTDQTRDEFWIVEHPPIFTLGQNGLPEHIHNPGTIPVLRVDRGGQVTYHGPGQLIIYTLIDLKAKHWQVRQLVNRLEQSIIDTLKEYHINAYADCKAPGVYVEQKKICSLGLRIRRGCSFHGLALNVQMDLEPFTRINPCGFPGLTMTQVSDYCPSVTLATITPKVLQHLMTNLCYTQAVNKVAFGGD